MGWIRHHAIVVTASFSDMEKLQAAADGCFGTGRCVVGSGGHNGYRTLLVPPDGSKEGWGPSDDGDEARNRFVEWLGAQAYDDGSSPYSWVEVEYGETEPVVTREGGNHS